MLKQQVLWLSKVAAMVALGCALVAPRASAQEKQQGKRLKLTVVNETPLPLTVERIREDKTSFMLPQPIAAQRTRPFATQPEERWLFKAGQRLLAAYKATDEPEQKVVIDLKSQGGNPNCAARFVNITPDLLEVLWVDFEGNEKPYGTVEPGAAYEAPESFMGHVWLFRKQNGRDIVDVLRLPVGRVKFNAQVGAFGVRSQDPNNPKPALPNTGQPAVESLPFYGGKSSLGRGFNMFAASPTEETVAQVLLFHGGLSEKSLYQNAVQVPGNVDLVPQTDQFQSDFTASYNAAEVQNSLQTALGIEGSFRGVTASVQATYGTEALRQQSTTFVEYRTLVRPAVAQFKAGLEKRLTPAFAAAIEQFRNPNAVNDTALQDRFFKDYGTHYVNQVTLGGSCNMIAKLKHTANMDKEDIRVAATASFDGKLFSVGVSTDVKLSQQRKRFEDSSRVTFTASGGDANIIVTGGGDRGQINRAAFDRWVSSLKNPNTLSDVGRRLSPIWDLAFDPTVKRNLQEAFNNYAQRRQQQLDATPFSKQVIGYTVEVRLDKVDIIDDQDTGIDEGDMFWDFTARQANDKRTLSHVARGNDVSMSSGTTYPFADVVTDKPSLTQIFDVKPGEWIDIEGNMTDEDGGINGADDPLGAFHFSFPVNGAQAEQTMTANLNGNAKVYFQVTIIERY